MQSIAELKADLAEAKAELAEREKLVSGARTALVEACQDISNAEIDRLAAGLVQAKEDVRTWTRHVVEEVEVELAGRTDPLGRLLEPEVAETATFVSRRDRQRCTGDLRARGLDVEEDDYRLTVTTPAGWTGTPAAEVIQAHGGTLV